jgi:hypothetical protein
MVPLFAIAVFERFFREAGGLDVDKDDLHRYDDFVQQKMYDLLVRGQATAKANDRGVIDVVDLPITKGLQESIHRFEHLDLAGDLTPAIGRLPIEPEMDLLLSDEARDALPTIAGGLSMALAQSFSIIDPRLTNPSSEHWERAFQLFRLLL